MQLIKSKDVDLTKKHKVFFSKKELQIILQLYSKQVSLGICKDYSIDHSRNNAIFSFFKSTFDKPIFQIEKKINVKNKYFFIFNLAYKQKILESSISISKILIRLEKKFQFFIKHKKDKNG